MIESQKTRIWVVLIVLVLAVFWVLPNFVNVGKNSILPNKELVYGLDIQGGLHLVMGVDVDGVITEKVERMADGFAEELKKENVPVSSVKVAPDEKKELVATFTESPAEQKLRDYIKEYYPTTLQIIDVSDNKARIRYYDSKIEEFRKQIVDQAIRVIRNRINEFGVSEPNIAAQGENRILVQLPGIENAARAKKLINRTARLTFHIVEKENRPDNLRGLIKKAEKEGGYSLGQEGLGYMEYLEKLNEDLSDDLPENTKVVFQKKEEARNLEAGSTPMLVRRDTNLGGDALEDASVRPGQYGSPEVVFSFNPDGRRKFSQITEENVGEQMAIVLDGTVKSAPVIQGKISSSTARITVGQQNYEKAQKEAQLIATTLRAGALPAALTQLEERTVGPTLGEDSIQKGKMAGVVGSILVLIFMLVYYRTLGVVANVALVFNLLLILALLTSLRATLTLPGVAGIVLTIGMAVDANVIIFERIREELRKGAGLQAGIKDGFGHAFSAIFDANVTTAAVCGVLMYYGTGPVRGFAVTLICGIATSMFTAIFVSRTVLEVLVKRFHIKYLTSA